jgi:hypothetical protein
VSAVVAVALAPVVVSAVAPATPTLVVAVAVSVALTAVVVSVAVSVALALGPAWSVVVVAAVVVAVLAVVALGAVAGTGADVAAGSGAVDGFPGGVDRSLDGSGAGGAAVEPVVGAVDVEPADGAVGVVPGAADRDLPAEAVAAGGGGAGAWHELGAADNDAGAPMVARAGRADAAAAMPLAITRPANTEARRGKEHLLLAGSSRCSRTTFREMVCSPSCISGRCVPGAVYLSTVGSAHVGAADIRPAAVPRWSLAAIRTRCDSALTGVPSPGSRTQSR